MTKTIFPYVEDEVFKKEVAAVLTKIQKSLAKIDKTVHKNVLDPFSAIFDASGRNLTMEEWLKEEKSRQLQKTLQNAIGYFPVGVIRAVHGCIFYCRPSRGERTSEFGYAPKDDFGILQSSKDVCWRT